MSRIWDSLYSKNGLAAKEIAKKLINIKKGERIPKIDDLVKELSTGRGTVQGALKVLENLNAIQLEPRGHLGTYLVKKESVLLKEIAGVAALIGAMPLPYSLHYEGLATGLIEVSEEERNRINLAYMRGSKNRMEALKSRRYDFVIMSQLAAEEEIKNDNNLVLAKNFGSQTYVTSHKVFFANPKENVIRPGMRIGIDHSSIDQSKITFLECEGIAVELVAVNYMQLFDNLLNGTLDAAVWNFNENRTKNILKVGDFQSEKAVLISEKASTAVIVTEDGREDVLHQLESLQTEKIAAIQQMVVNKKKLPHY